MKNNLEISKSRTLWGLSIGHFILDSYAAILIPLYPLIASRLNINLAQISLTIALGHAVSSLLQPVFGYISDKLNKRIFMFFGLVFASVFVPFGFFAPNASILTLCLILGMAGNAFYHPQTTSMIKDCFKDNLSLSRAIGIFLGLGTIGYALAPYFSVYFLQTFKDKNYALIGLFGLAAAFLALFIVPKIEHKENKSEINFSGAIKEILSSKVCMFLVFITVIKAALVMSYGTYIPFLLKKFDFTLNQTGFIITLFYVAGGISMITSSKLEKIIKLKGMILASYVPLLPLNIISLCALRYNKTLAIIFFILSGFFVLLAASVVLAHAQRTTTKYTGTVSGIIQGFTLALGSLLLIPFGLIGEHFGIEAVLILISTSALLSSLFALKIKLD